MRPCDYSASSVGAYTIHSGGIYPWLVRWAAYPEDRNLPRQNRTSGCQLQAVGKGVPEAKKGVRRCLPLTIAAEDGQRNNTRTVKGDGKSFWGKEMMELRMMKEIKARWPLQVSKKKQEEKLGESTGTIRRWDRCVETIDGSKGAQGDGYSVPMLDGLHLEWVPRIGWMSDGKREKKGQMDG